MAILPPEILILSLIDSILQSVYVLYMFMKLSDQCGITLIGCKWPPERQMSKQAIWSNDSQNNSVNNALKL